MEGSAILSFTRNKAPEVQPRWLIENIQMQEEDTFSICARGLEGGRRRPNLTSGLSEGNISQDLTPAPGLFKIQLK